MYVFTYVFLKLKKKGKEEKKEIIVKNNKNIFH